MRIGIIGAGHIGQALAQRLSAAGHEVLLSNSRGPESLADVVGRLGPGVRAVTARHRG
ncbi:NAD(P)-binding domain-containing protein, partial [Deinococcus pimensis]|uniref:NAD(P)-binding domain-containing protein n=1 Tax=Deinococcus pimensis TaxID=309888 RepID=UPI00146FA532